MKKTAPVFPVLALSVSILASPNLNAQVATNFSGLWNGVYLSVPQNVSGFQGQDGVVTNVPQADAFESGAFEVFMNGDGTFNGPGGSGTITITGQGTAVVQPNDGGPISFRVNHAMDLLVGTAAEDDGSGAIHSLNLVVKAPASVATNEVTGTWNIKTFATPASLVEVFGSGTNSNNKLRDLKGIELDSVTNHVFTELGLGTLTLNADGTFSGAMEEAFSGTYQLGTNGYLQLNLGGEEPLIVPLSLNAGKNTLIGLNTADLNRQEVIIAVKPPATVAPEDVKGLWLVTSYNTPSTIELGFNTNGFVIAVNPSERFEMNQVPFSAAHNGFLTANFEGQPHIGAFFAGPNGAVTAVFTNLNNGEVQSHAGHINASKDCITLVETEENGDGKNLTVLVKAPPSPQPARQLGLIIASGTVFWAGDTNLALHSATDLNGSWSQVPGTVGENSFQPSGAGAAFFRVGTATED